jgi:heterogeneous nuclear ribonucleoprotein A1/A3
MLQGNLSLTPSKIFVGGLSPSTDVELLKEAFGSFGKIVDAVVVLDRESGLSRGFGFVTYDSIEVANNAMQAMQNKELDGRIIGVHPADSGGGGGGGGFCKKGRLWWWSWGICSWWIWSRWIWWWWLWLCSLTGHPDMSTAKID